MKIDIIAFSFILVLIPVALLYKERILLSKEILLNSIRAFLQLSLLGFLLGYLFKIENYFYYIPILVFIFSYAAFIARKRVGFSFWYPFLTFFITTSSILFLLVYMNIISLKPSEFIPISGMIVGNALNTYTLTIERLKREIKTQMELVEALVAVGASLKEAYQVFKIEAIKAAMIPINNMLQTIGVVAIPGITTGMLLAGASALEAISYQIVIIYMLVSVALFTSLLGSSFYISHKSKTTYQAFKP